MLLFLKAPVTLPCRMEPTRKTMILNLFFTKALLRETYWQYHRCGQVVLGFFLLTLIFITTNILNRVILTYPQTGRGLKYVPLSADMDSRENLFRVYILLL